LRERLDEVRALGKDAIVALIEEFPDGWERRRAIQALFRAGIPASVEPALVLLESLASHGDRTWCALTLFETRGDEPGCAERIVDAVPSSRIRRRALRGR